MGIELIVGQTNQEVIEVHPTVPSPPGPVGPQGTKGDPGGFTVSSSYTGDLNALITPGLYAVPSSAANMPITGSGAHVQVQAFSSYVFQRVVARETSRVESTYYRLSANAGSTWTAWIAEGKQALNDHTAATDPHTQYARKGAANTFTQQQHFSTNSYQIMLQRANNAVDLKNWWFFVESDGSVRLIPKADDGVSTNGRGTVVGRDGSLQVGDQRFLSGTGMPNGVVSAPVGSRYVDTAATNGAIEWIKATGAGNTGWQVVYGDTGWRLIHDTVTWNESAVNVSDPSLSLAVRRIGSECVVRVSGRAPSTTVTNQQLFTGWPDGWPPDVNGAYIGAIFNTSNNQDVHGLATILSTGITVGRVTANSLFRIYVRYETASPWPSVLP